MRQIIAILTNLPLTTQLALAAAWFAGALAGALVAKLIARLAWAAWAVALVVTIYFGLNALVLPLPLWVKALWIAGPLLGGLLGNRLVAAGPAVATTDGEAPAAIS